MNLRSEEMVKLRDTIINDIIKMEERLDYIGLLELLGQTTRLRNIEYIYLLKEESIVILPRKLLPNLHQLLL